MHRYAALCAALAVFAAPCVQAQPAASYPDRAARIVVPYGPGTGPDLIARVAAEQLSKRLGQSFVVENRLGAAGKIGTEAVAGAAPDGYTLLLGGKDTHGVLTHLYPTWSVKPERDFAPISLLARIQNIIVANPGLPIATPKDLIALAQRKELRYGTPGIGTNLHLMAAMLQNTYGLKLLHIPYSRSFAEAMPALVRGELDLVVAGMPPVMSLVKDGRIKAVAVTGAERSRFAPDVPTFAESGIPGLESGGWFGLFAPRGTPDHVIAVLSRELGVAMASPEVKAKLEGIYADPVASTPAALAELVADETARWGKVVKENRITVE